MFLEDKNNGLIQLGVNFNNNRGEEERGEAISALETLEEQNDQLIIENDELTETENKRI